MANRVHGAPLSAIALARPITVLVALVSAIVLGAVALAGIPIELIPAGFAAPVMSVNTSYPNATARDVEERITKPIEQAVATTPGVEEIRAESSSSGSNVTLVFEGSADMDVAYREVRDRVARVRGEMPDDVRRVNVFKHSTDGFPIAFYGVSWDESIEEPYSRIDRHLKRALERIDGVAVVQVRGAADPELRIELNRSLAEAANIDLLRVVQTLRDSNFTLASGTLREGADRYLLRSLGTYKSTAELEKVVVGENGIRLGDVARVRYLRPSQDFRVRVNGEPAMVLSVIKESQANTVEVSDAVKAAVDAALKSPGMEGFAAYELFLQGDAIRFSLSQVTDAGMQGGLLALLVLLFFLRRLRLTLVIALSIPLSLFLALPAMYFSGQTVNIVSLIGLMICVGLVVDNSVVVAENVERYRRRGMGPYAGALHGVAEVTLAITLATMTTMIVFLPASLLSSGATQFFMVRLVTPVCVSLLASLFVALVLIPVTSAMFSGDVLVGDGALVTRLAEIDRRWKSVLGRAYAATIGRLNGVYVRLLRVCLRRRVDVVAVGFLALMSVGLPAQHVHFRPAQSFGSRNVGVFYDLPGDATLREADAFFRKVEGILEANKDELGIERYFVRFDQESGWVQAFFGRPKPGQPEFSELSKSTVELLPERPGWQKRSRLADSDGGENQAFMVMLYANEHDELEQAKRDLEATLVRVPGVLGLQGNGNDDRRQELALTMDRTMGERFGVTAGSIANTISYAVRGTPLPRYRAEDREVDVWVLFRPEDRNELDALRQFKVRGSKGDLVPISVLTEKHVRESEASLSRNNKRVSASISLELDKESREATVGKIQRLLRDYNLPEGVTFDADREGRQNMEDQMDLLAAGALGCVFIFLLMGFLFESFILPLSVMPSIPLSFVGVWWTLWATSEHIDMLAAIGILLLLGVVVNNGIVLVDFVNQARRAGLSREDAVVQAGDQRFRPILMTAMTTVGGMIPLAVSEATGEGLAYAAFGKTLVGGMITATVLTLVVVPVAYTLLDDLRSYTATWAARLRG